MKILFFCLLAIQIINPTLQAETVIQDKIIIAGPFASVSHPFFHMIKTDALKDVAKKVEFVLWKNPDELRAIAIKGEVDFIAVPTNTAAILSNKGVDIRLLNVSVWGILAMISRDPNLKTLSDYKGKKVAIPFRADMPDIVFTQLLKKQGINPKKDLDLVFVSSPIDAMQMLIMRRIDHALLAEPAISMALRKTKSFPVNVIAPDLYRSVDLQNEWARVFDTDNNIPQAGIAVLGRMKSDHVIRRFLEEYDRSVSWYMAHPQEAGQLVESKLPMLDAEAVADSIAHVNLRNIGARDAQQKLEFFFNILKQENPKSIGGKLPDQGFYYYSD